MRFGEIVPFSTAKDCLLRSWLSGVPAIQLFTQYTHVVGPGRGPSLASRLVAGNVNLALVRQCLGHKAIGSTMKYVAVSDS